MSDREYEAEDLNLIYETEDAYKVSCGSVEAWLPKAAVSLDESTGNFFMSENLARDKGLI